MAQWVEAHATEPDNLCLSPGTYVAGKLNTECCPLTFTFTKENKY